MFKLTRLHHRYSLKKILKGILGEAHEVLRPHKQQNSLLVEQEKGQKIPQTTQQMEKKMVNIEFEVSGLERNRMRRLDQELGTKTHFHQTQYYQQRLDSEHIMDITFMKSKFIIDNYKKRRGLVDPQRTQRSTPIIRKHQYYESEGKTRKYPVHPRLDISLSDETDPVTIQFLAKEVTFTRSSLNQVEDIKSTFMDEGITMPPGYIYSKNNVYFMNRFEAAFSRVDKVNFQKTQKILKNYKYPEEVPEQQTEKVMSTQELYKYLVNFDKDLRISKYVGQIQNSETSYLLDRLIWNSTEKYIGIIIDVSINKESQYCIAVKNTATGHYHDKIFMDVQPDAVILGNNVIMVQKDQHGLFREVVSLNLVNGDTRLLYQETSDNYLKLQLDPTEQYVYLYRSSISNPFRQSVLYFKIDFKEFQLLIPEEKGTKYRVYASPNGIIYGKFKQPSENIRLTVGEVSEQIWLIPYQTEKSVLTWKEERRLQKMDQIKELLRAIDEKVQEKPQELKLGTQHTLYFKCQPNSYVREMTCLAGHLVLNIQSYWNTAEENRLQFISHRKDVPQTGLVMEHPIKLQSYQDFTSQNVLFSLRNLMESQYIYSIWSQQLREAFPDEYYSEDFTVPNGDFNINCTMYCDKKFMGQPLMTVIYVPTYYESIQGYIIRSLLKKGIMVVTFKGRGTLFGKLSDFEAGIGQNRMNNVKDLIHLARHLTDSKTSLDISAYGSGHIGAYTVLMANILEPQLFTASALYNGHYDAHVPLANKDYKIMSRVVNNDLNPLTLPFTLKKDQEGIYISDLSNIILMSDEYNRLESRKLLKKIRSDRKNYMEFFYYEAMTEHEADLQALCFIFKLMLINCVSDKKVQ